ncbi:MAG TPA: Uma2 family endonuclease [Gemmataceae bacterium]|nr:Uma2 family endonuclease [Gemmataceae bacterium]
MRPTAILMSAEDLARWPQDGMRHELVRGELRTRPPAGSEHGAVGMNLAFLLTQHVRAQQLGVVFGAETGFLIARDPDTVRAPDIAFVSQDHIPATGIPRAFWPGAPDLALEVVSPGDTVFEVDEKVQEWLDAGTRLVWVVNPRRRTVTVYRSATEVRILTEQDTLEGGETVRGFRCLVRDIFV